MPFCCMHKHTNAVGAIWCTTCESLIAGVRVDDYVIVSYLGRGSSSVVYQAGQYSLNNRKVVLKVFQAIGSHRCVSDFQREAALLASLEHPYILPIYGYGVIRERRQDEAPYTPYLILPYAGQGSLDEVFQREGRRPWSVKRVLPIIEETAAALSYAHQRGVLHRDVKPGNLLLMGSHVLLSDFGVSSLIDAEKSHMTINMAGSPAFMAPEVWECHPGRYSDQYALAVTCFYLLSGEYPWEHTATSNMHAWSYLHRHVAPRALYSCRRDLSMDISMVLQRALAKDPHERYPSLSAFASDLRAATLDITLEAPWEVLRGQIMSSAPQVMPFAPPVPQVVPVPPRPLLASGPVAEVADMPQNPGLPETDALNNMQLPVTPLPGSMTGSLRKDRWTKQALLMNVLVCLLFAVMAYGLKHDIGDVVVLARALWPALIVGPCIGLWFRYIVPVSTAKGMLYGVCFGCVDTLISALACFVWETLWQTFVYHWGKDWIAAGQGLSFFILEGGKLLMVASVMTLVGLSFTMLGGIVIGLFATRDQVS